MINFRKQLDQWGPIESRILYTSFWFLPVAGYVGKAWGAYWPEITGVLDHDRVTYFWEKEEMERRGLIALKKWILPKNKRLLLWRSYQTMSQSLKRQARSIQRITGSASIERAAPLAMSWYQKLIDFWSLTCVFELANFAAPSFLRRQLAPYVPNDKQQEALEALLAPDRPSFHQESELALLMIADKRGRARARAIKEHAAAWRWVANSYYESKRLTERYFLKQIQGWQAQAASRKIKGIQEYSRRVKERKRAVARAYGLPPAVLKAAAALAFSIWWQDHRKGMAWWSHAYTDILSKVARRKYKLSHDDIMHYTAEEWRDLFHRGILLPLAAEKARKNFFLIDLHDNVYDSYTGRRAREIARSLARRGHSAALKTIRGTPVSRGPGLVRGIVRILISSRRAHLMRKGEILVAPMTSPDYILAMRKAAAIITDVGGLMSHAAIVSRELGVPCVVGAKIATKVFKDGDMVEVDAEKGTVKKVK